MWRKVALVVTGDEGLAARLACALQLEGLAVRRGRTVGECLERLAAGGHLASAVLMDLDVAGGDALRALEVWQLLHAGRLPPLIVWIDGGFPDDLLRRRADFLAGVEAHRLAVPLAVEAAAALAASLARGTHPRPTRHRDAIRAGRRCPRHPTARWPLRIRG